MRIDLTKPEYGDEYHNGDKLHDLSYCFETKWIHSYKVCPFCGTEYYTSNASPVDRPERCTLEMREGGFYSKQEIAQETTALRALLHSSVVNTTRFKEMPTCLVCGAKLPTDSPDGFYFVQGMSKDESRILGTDNVFKMLKERRIEAYHNEAEIRLQEKVKDLSEAGLGIDEAEQGSMIRGNQDLLSKYVSHVLKIESAIYATEKRLQELYFADAVAAFDSLVQRGKALFSLSQELEKTIKSYNSLKKKSISSRVKRGTIVLPPAPIEPIKPASFTRQEPREPQYGVPGFLNKKKVLAKNEELRLTYQKDMQAFEDAKAAHEREMQVYQVQMDQYNAEYFQYAAKRSEENARVEREYQADLAKERERHSKKIDEANRLVEQKRQDLDEVRSTLPQTAALTVIREEIKTAENTLGELLLCRKKLYAQNVIYPKYRNIIAVASFNDYILSGRCETLEGNNGAYDKYEIECRADMIISKLTDVLSSLEKIKDNQYMLYTQISEVNNGLNKLNSTMEKAVETLKTISSDTDAIRVTTSSINAHTAQIAENSEVIAYNTAATAFYAKKNTELTNALGFMAALK